jgi:hypothetical protein
MLPQEIESTQEQNPSDRRTEDALLLFLAGAVLFGLIATVVLLCAGY